MLNLQKVLTFIPDATAAMQKSKDRRTKVGAIILDPEYGTVASGWNGFPRKVDDSIDERYESPLKYWWTVHAEMNAIANAARRGVPLKDCEVLIVGNIICARCCALMIQSGIRAVHNPRMDLEIPAHKRLEHEYLIAMQMMLEANVFHHAY